MPYIFLVDNRKSYSLTWSKRQQIYILHIQSSNQALGDRGHIPTFTETLYQMLNKKDKEKYPNKIMENSKNQYANSCFHP